MLVLFTVTFCLSFSQQGQSAFSPRIIQGTSAAPGEFPFVVSIQKLTNGKWKHFCGGTLIKSEKTVNVLTAAQCFTRPMTEGKELSVLVGTINQENDDSMGKHYTFKSKNTYPGYDPEAQQNDVAVGVLNETLDSIQTAELPLEDYDMVSKTCTVLGWGHTESGSSNGSISKFLQKANVTVYLSQECEKQFGTSDPSFKPNTGNMCAEKPPHGFCEGDTGGPLMCWHDTQPGNHMFVAGVISREDKPCGEVEKPGFYARVSHPDYLAFIKDPSGRLYKHSARINEATATSVRWSLKLLILITIVVRRLH